MPEILKIVFFLSLLVLLQTYLFYPISVFLYSLIRNKSFSVNKSYKPAVSVIISAYNEEKVIEKTLLNFLKTNYPMERLEFIIGSDCSTDGTNNIMNRLSQQFPNVHFYEFNNRRGKASVLNDLVTKASGEILVFSDANTMFDPDAIGKLVMYYDNPDIGGVCGRLILNNPQLLRRGNHEKNYWEIENRIKEWEGKIGCLIGANGGIYSIRKEFFEPIPVNSPVMDDFFVSLKVLEKGHSFIYEQEAQAVEEVADDYKIEYKRKIRNNAIDLSTIKYIKSLLNPSRGFTAYALWSHKIIRWFSPVILLLLLISNALLLNYNDFFYILFWLQVLFYLSAVAGYFLSRMNIRLVPFNLSFYFVLINIALLVGIYRFITNKQKSHWQSTPR
jgi:cellulose synthase/poly-beta-1,6-N-acetylglucosamine synthase-like glycosyltransferase